MPPAKKRRIAAAAAAAELAESTTTTQTNDSAQSKLLQQHQHALDTLLQTVDQLSSSNKLDNNNLSESILSSTLALANLKSLQRQIALQVETQANQSKEQRVKVEECSLLLENLTYERNYLQKEIQSLEGWKADDLEKMAWAELGRTSAATKRSTNEMKELGEEDVDMGDATTNDITTAEDAINAYLFNTATTSSMDHRNPTNHTAILQKLQSDIETRSSLITQLSQSKSKLKELHQKREELSGFLNHQIPKKVKELEKGAESLNAFFGGQDGVWSDLWKVDKRSGVEKDDHDDNDDDDLKKKKKVQSANMLINRPSFDRSKRFQLAKSNLPPPLYVLYVQLAGYKDAWESLEKVGECDGNKSNVLGGYVGASGMEVTVEKNTESDWRVVLSLSISAIVPSEVASTFGKAGSSNSRSSSPAPGQSSLSIVFSYDKEDGVVYALVDANGNKDVGEGLLESLFPDDDGSTLPNVSLSLSKTEEEEDEAESDEGESSKVAMDNMAEAKTAENKKGKAYYWCQVLSGLNFPPPFNMIDAVTDQSEKDTPFAIQICTKAVMRQLLRRIRARQTLSSLVDFLGRRGQFANPIPIHPKMKCDDASDNNAPTLKAKLQSWSKEEDMKRYVATIKRKSATLKASVTISDNYPAEPPVWSLQNEDGSVGTASSSQNNSSSNADVLFDASLHRIECHVNQDLNKFVCEDVEATFDWVLIHQLADIISCWDEMMSAKEEGNNANKSKAQERIRKGKDRKLVGFGEKSPFFWYRNGL